jgi:type IV fimbrial biogenesis protein FimT
MLNLRYCHRGFTLVELMVTISLMALLLFMAAPSLSTYVENSKVRGIAESFFASAQQARAEAIRRNKSVEMVLTTDSPTVANVETTNLSATAGSWLVRVIDDDAAATTFAADAFVEGKDIREGSGRSDGTSQVTVSAVSNGVATSSIIFRSGGNTSLGAPWSISFASSGNACAPTGSVRCLRVVVTASGQVKSCDPVAVAPDSRAC